MMIASLRSRSRKFIHTFGDTHIYNNHTEQLKLQLSRKKPYQNDFEPNKDIFQFDFDDFTLEGYSHIPD
jgi:thymidylate synthase